MFEIEALIYFFSKNLDVNYSSQSFRPIHSFLFHDDLILLENHFGYHLKNLALYCYVGTTLTGFDLVIQIELGCAKGYYSMRNTSREYLRPNIVSSIRK